MILTVKVPTKVYIETETSYARSGGKKASGVSGLGSTGGEVPLVNDISRPVRQLA